ncbi:ricin-type beta-trefoil lectin domain protein [Streptomyces sp. NPDC051907]|uniref:ricin-type beta-trefoil lectin domain protein n=1 Tax=Streptomyces sp. NPDC051907 TaxID=3155284 RepID=UPI0034193B73
MSGKPVAQPLSELSDGELTAIWLKGKDRSQSHRALAELVSRHRTSVFRYAGLCTTRTATATRLTGAAFIRVRRQAQREGARPFAWRPALLVATLRTAADWAARGRHQGLGDAFLAWLREEGNARLAREGERASLARLAFMDLPEPTQSLVWHGAVEDDPPAVLGRLTGQDADVAARQLARARTLFREACVQAHRARTGDTSCAAYAGLLDAATRNAGVQSPADLARHLLECARCRSAARELAQHGDLLAPVLAEGVLPWGARQYLPARLAGGEDREREDDQKGDQEPDGDGWSQQDFQSVSNPDPSSAAQPAVSSSSPHPRPVCPARPRAGGVTASSVLAGVALLATAALGTAFLASEGDDGPGSVQPPTAAPSRVEGSSAPNPGPDPKPTPTPTADPSPDAPRTELRNAATGQCLSPADDVPAPRQTVVSRRCTGVDSQRWILGADALVRNGADPGLCLGPLAGDSVLLLPCDGDSRIDPRQDLRVEWNFRGELTPYAARHLVIAPVPSTGADPVALEPRDGTPSQTWLGGRPISLTPRTR